MDYYEALNIFYSFNPNIELHCKNFNCKSHYYISSNIFYFIDADQNTLSGGKVSRLSMSYESCKVDNIIFRNDWVHNNSIIHSKVNNMRPIIGKFIPLNMSYDKFKAKINTIVIFQ